MTITQASALPSSGSLIVKIAAQPDFTAVETMPRGAARKAAAWQALTDTAQKSQAPFIAIADQLKSSGAISGYQLLTSPNALLVTPASGKSQAVLGAFSVAGVSSIYDNSNGSQVFPKSPAQEPVAPSTGPLWGLDVTGRPAGLTTTAPDRPYGVTLVGAPEAWAQGADGRGLVFGSIDTGTDGTHENLKGNYRGANADGSVTNDYNWADFGGSNAQAPRDFDTHGTHTMGTAVGKDTGVAPGAKWISVHGLADGVDAALKSLQWMQAPTKLDGSAPDATKAPDVVGMSWYMGKNNESLFRESIRNLAAAGIETVKSAGNQGPGAATITSPGQFPEIIATAAVDSNGKVANFSSRGPAPWPNGSTTSKPDFAAPGVDVVSSLPGGKYGKMSGTSMAQPHMSGVLLDILSKYPQLTHAQLVQVLAAGATDAGKPGVDAEYGAGIVNLPKALAAAQQLVGGGTAVISGAAAPRVTAA